MYHDVAKSPKRIISAVAAAAMVMAFGSATVHAKPSDPVKCKRAINKEAKNFERDKAKRLKKCEDFEQNGKDAATVLVCQTDALAQIDAKAAALKDKVAKACCGSDKTCDGIEDLAVGAIDWDARVKVCGTGDRAGLACAINTDCPGNCAGGANAGIPCQADNQCPSSTCDNGRDCALGGDLCPNLENGKASGYLTPTAGAALDAVNCGVCEKGATQGSACRQNSDCVVCNGGSNAGDPCSFPSDCPGGSCAASVCKPGRPLDGPADVAECLLCFGEAGVDQVIDLAYSPLNPVNNAKAFKKLKVCKRTIGKETQKFFDKKRNFLSICSDKVLNGKQSPPCPDAATSTKITAAQTSMTANITSKCGTFSVSEIGAPIVCPNVGTCGGPIDTVAQLADCLACVAEFKVDCADALASSLSSELPAECNTLCGNGKVDVGETCDDGNLVDGDSCPSTCVYTQCADSGSTATAHVNVTPPAGVTDLSSMTVYVDYPDNKVRIPGSGNAQSVQDSINVDSGALFNPNDLDYALLNVLFQIDPSQAITNPAFDVTFQICAGESAPGNGEFRCLLREGGSTPNGTAVYGGSCSVTVGP